MDTHTDDPLVLSLNPQADQRVCILSDLHYGHDRSLAPPPRELIASLGDVDILVIAGDLAETRSFHACYERGFELREELRAASAEAGIQLIELAGNHDVDAPHMMLRLWDGKVVVVHGHMFFDEVAPWGWEYIHNKKRCDELIVSYPHRDSDLGQRLELARRMSLLKPPCHRISYQTAIPLLNKLLHCFWPPQRPWRIINAWLTAGRRAERFAKHFAPECSYLVFGHVHRTGKWQHGTRHLLSTGAWFKHAEAARTDFINGEMTAFSKL